MSRWARLLALGALALALADCGNTPGESLWLLHVAQFRVPFGQSRLLNYDYPQLTLRGERELGSLSTRAVVTPDGTEIWVGSEASRDVIMLNAKGDSILGRANLGASVGAIAFDPTGRWGVVAHGSVLTHEGEQPNATLMNTALRKPVRAFKVGLNPRAACFGPAGKRIFVGNTGDSTLTVIDLEAGHAVDSLAVGWGPVNICPDPLGRWLYVSCLGEPGHQGRARGAVHVLALPGLEELAVFRSGQHPSQVTALPGGDRILVSELKVGDEVCHLRLFTVAQDAAGAPQIALKKEIQAGDNPLAGSLSPDGLLFAVPDFGACRVALIDTEGERFLRWLQLPGTQGEHYAVDAVWTRRVQPVAAAPSAAPADSL
jgi:YVTN family beta-propeller protein